MKLNVSTMLRWNEEVTCKFVKLYLSHECLWNRNHDDYKIKNKRAMANKEILKEFKNSTGIALSEPELSIKIKSLRSTYTQEVAKIKQRSTSDWTYKPSLRWFSDWDKCLRKVDGNLNLMSILEDGNDPTMENNQEDSHERIWVSNSTEDNADPFDDEYNIILKLEPEENSQTKAVQNTKNSKQKKVKQRSPSTDCSYNTFRSSIDSRTESVEDEFDIYGKYIASQLRKMNLQKALRVQLEIQSLVSEARLSDIEGNNN